MPERSLIVRLLLLAGILLLLIAATPDRASLFANETATDTVAELLPGDGDSGPDAALPARSPTHAIPSGTRAIATADGARPFVGAAHDTYWPHAPPA